MARPIKHMFRMRRHCSAVTAETRSLMVVKSSKLVRLLLLLLRRLVDLPADTLVVGSRGLGAVKRYARHARHAR